MLTDAAGLALALFAINFARKPATPQRTYGFYRVEILAALANSVVLILVSGYILYEACNRIIEPPQIHSFPVIAVASVGLVVNFISIRLPTHTHGREDNEEENLNIKGHVVVIDPSKCQSIIGQINSILEKRFKIDQMTIQIETYHPHSDLI
jgi:cobalt-zinc-cadmium efflux system protein